MKFPGFSFAPLCLFLALTSTWQGAAQLDPLGIRTDYRNELFTDTPTFTTNASIGEPLSVAFFSGNIGGLPTDLPASTNIVRPTDGQYYLLQSIIGQPVGLTTIPFNLLTNGSGTITPSPNMYAATNWYQLGQTVALMAQPGRYYAFSNWLDISGGSQRSINLIGATNITAVFTNTVPLESLTNNGVVRIAQSNAPLVLLNGIYYSNNIVPAAVGAQFSMTVTSTFPGGSVRWSTNGSPFVLYTNPVTVTAPFSIQTIARSADNSISIPGDGVNSVSLSTPGAGSVLMSSASDFYTGQPSITVTAAPNSGWVFTNWLIDLDGGQNPQAVQVSTALVAQAVFATPMTTRPGSVGTGTILRDPDLSLYPFGSVVRISAVPSTGYYFSDWGGPLTGSFDTPVDFAVTNANPTNVANFFPLPGGTFSLTVLIKGGGTVGAHAPYYNSGVVTNLVATTNAGQTFTGWYDVANGASNLLSMNTTLPVTMNTNKLIQATFIITQPTFVFTTANYTNNEADHFAQVTVQNLGLLDGRVSFATLDDSALSNRDYTALSTNLYFTNPVRSITISIPISDQFVQLTNRSFGIALSGPVPLGTASSAFLGSQSNADVTILYNDAIASVGSQLVQKYPDWPPNTNGAIEVTISTRGTNDAYGRWRLPWELGWRDSGAIASNQEPGNNYFVDFKVVSNYLAVPIPPFTVASGTVTPQQNIYEPALQTPGLASLTISFQPNTPIGAGWRLYGEAVWNATNTAVSGLIPGAYSVEFEPVNGFATPTNLHLSLGVGDVAYPAGAYQPVSSLPLYKPLPISDLSSFASGLTNSPRLPYAFCGQLWSRTNGFASGFVVSPSVVLTAQHAIFDDVSLSYVEGVYWFFQKQEGTFNSRPIPVRGSIRLGGYVGATPYTYSQQRSLDVTNSAYGTNVSSPLSREIDVAALYFLEPAGRGGYGGYLSSDAATNEWLSGNFQKMLVGYPVDASQYGYTNIIRGQMHATPPGNYAFLLQTNVPGSHVYATTNMLGLPGNSGGPLCVLDTNNVYYPAAVFLGTVNNAWVVRSIDTNVVYIINQAGTLGDAGQDNTGGGPITFAPIPGLSGSHPGYVKVHLGPTNAVVAGAGWRVVNDPVFGTDSTFGSDPNYTRAISSTNASIDFTNIPGWDLPPPQYVTNLVPDGIVTLTANYSIAATQAVSPGSVAALNGFGGGPLPSVSTIYAITNLGEGTLIWTASASTNWLTISNAAGVVIGNTASNLLVGHALTNLYVTVNGNALSLPLGSHTNVITFANRTNSYGTTVRTIVLSVLPHPTVLFDNAHLLPNGDLSLTLSGITNRPYAIVSSTNLLDPISVWATNQVIANGSGGQASITIPASSGAQTFFRAKEL